jgi:soluble lytic murein transglycosylase-like protein
MTKAEIIARITEVANEHGIDPVIGIRQCEKESSFNPAAVNKQSGAEGLFQFMPETAAELGFDPMDPEQAIRGWGSYMAWLMNHFGGNIEQTLAAYNFGVGHISRLLRSMGPDDDWKEHLPLETQNYIAFIVHPEKLEGIEDV